MNKDVQLAAIDTIGEMTKYNPTNLGVLVQIAENEHNDLEVREASIRVLGESGGFAKPYLPALIRLQKHDPHHGIRDIADQSLTLVKEAPEIERGWFGFVLGGLTIATLVVTGLWIWRTSHTGEPHQGMGAVK